MTITDVHGSSYYLTITHNTVDKLHKMLNLKMTSLGSRYGKQSSSYRWKRECAVQLKFCILFLHVH